MQFTVDIHDLVKAKGFWYLATPYTRYPGTPHEAWSEACKIAGELIKLGISIYCPVAETHPIAIESGIDLFDADLWIEVDKPKLDASCGLIVAKMPSWEISKNIDYEIAETRKANKPVIFLDV